MSFRIEMRALSKQFGETTALYRFSETLFEGERVSVIGHNGAGKSTLLNLLATLTRPSSGSLEYFSGQEALREKNQIRAAISYLSHEPMLYPDLTALENLRFCARMLGKAEDDASLNQLLAMVGMDWAAQRLFRNCSRGMRQRLSLARAFMGDPRLLLLDEPFTGLDRGGIDRLCQLFRGEDRSWVMVTHHLRLGYELANRFWILQRGRLLHSVQKANLSFAEYLALSQPATGDHAS